MVSFNKYLNSIEENKKNGIKGFIYKLVNTVDNLIYIGSTSINLEVRFAIHKSHSKKSNTKLYTHMRNTGCDKFAIELIETVKADNPKSLKEIEGEYIRNLNTVANGLNSNVANMHSLHSKEKKKDYMKEYMKDYMKNYWKTEKGSQYVQDYKERKRENERKRKELKRKKQESVEISAPQPEVCLT
jgi:group I intron endonuclease